MMPIQGTHNPRNLREKYQGWLNKKVIVGLTTFHYLCGHWKSFDGYYAVFQIGDQEHRVLLDEIDNVAEAPGAQAEYFK
jgi:hypothetical protein